MMGRKLIYENYRVEADPRDPPPESHEGQMRQLEVLAASIRRHCDVRTAVARVDRIGVCEFCGRYWTEDANDPHNGGCCKKDAANMPKESEASA